MTKAGLFNVLPGFMAVLLTVLAVIGVRKNGLFGAVAPKGPNSAAAGAWLQQAYESWWAAINNTWGLLAYGTMASVVIFVILVQNIVGIFCVYIIVCLPAVAELDADWLNRDGAYGWLDFARVFRSTVWSLALHGLTLSVILATLGIRNFPWVFGLVAIWIVMVPLYTILPSMVFRRVQATVKSRRIEAVDKAREQAGISDLDVVGLLPFRNEIDRVNLAKVNPLRVRPFELPAFVTLVMLPVLLTAAQVVIPLFVSNK